MERLTEAVKLFGKKIMHRATEEAYYCKKNNYKIINYSKIINKLGQFEDLMDKHDFKNIVELENALNGKIEKAE